MTLKRSAGRARAAWRRDVEAGVPTRALVRKGVGYLLGTALAPFYLREVDEVGAEVRALWRPRVVNDGYMAIGQGTILRSVNVPVELATGPQGRLRIGRDVSINYGVSIGCLRQVDIGDRCRLGPYVMIVDCDFHDLYDRGRRPPARPVCLGDDVWVGAKASILPGVTIGRGAVVGTGSVVVDDVAAFTVVAGAPARVIRTLTPELFVTPNLVSLEHTR
jgi:acetyltransferase-like isoleucine patch superfamily enzyme